MTEIKEEIVLNDDELICVLTGDRKKANAKEQMLQSVILQMNEEYGFEMSDMKRDYAFSYEDEEGKKKRMTVDLAIFRAGAPKEPENLDEKIVDIADFPALGESIDDMERMGDRAQPRKPANDSLIRTFKRCHDYIYGNEGRKKDAFWELLNLIFCKIYDEKRRYLCAERNETYHRQFWVGVTERNTPEGQAAVAQRIKAIFEQLKTDEIFKEVFVGNEQISLSDYGIAYVASEIAKYSFLDATVDVKGTAYETIVSNTLKQEAGQFFTPRNVIKCMVDIINPTENCRVLDPACGSGGFLVMVLDKVRHQIAKEIYPELSGALLEAKANSDVVNERVRHYAENMIFGFDFDPDLKKAAKMNMVMAGDGHSNIYNINSLEYPNGSLPDIPKVTASVAQSVQQKGDLEACDNAYSLENAMGKFDCIFTNPPFGSKVEVASTIAANYELKAFTAPEVLFIEQCYNFLKPGGKMAIVLPDGILGNPNTESVRKWILEHFKLIASIDLPVETFLPQVGVQASLLFLQKKTALEKLVDIKNENYDVFMAIAEKVGKDRRGNVIYEKDDDGAEILFVENKEWASYNRQGELIARQRTERVKHVDDDLPKISEAFTKFLEDEA